MSHFIGLKLEAMFWLTHPPQIPDCSTVPDQRGWTGIEVAKKEKDRCTIQYLRLFEFFGLKLIKKYDERNP